MPRQRQAISAGNQMIEHSALSILLGGFIGAILALTGAGGGILAVPVLVFGLDLSMPLNTLTVDDLDELSDQGGLLVLSPDEIDIA
jgi:hypothetical protein